MNLPEIPPSLREKFHLEKLRSSLETLNELLPIEHQLFGLEGWSQQTLDTDLSSPFRHYFAVRETESGLIAGYGGVQFLDVGEVTTLGVRPQFQRLGIGRYLLEVLEACALEQAGGVPVQMFLEVRVGNQGAIALYKRSGYSVIDKRKNYYTLPTEDALIMRKRLA